MFWIFITYVCENFYLCYDGDEMVGVYSLKFELTPYLLHYGGHVGYAVVPDKRCRGLATAILRQGLKDAKAMGKVILHNGGVLENKLFDPEEQVYVKRYWITL